MVVLKTARFISLLLTALATGIVFTHVLKISNKATLPGSIYLNVQQVLYQNWGQLVGAIEVGALLSTLAVLFLVRQHRLAFFLTSLGTLCVVAMILVWAIFINPINMQINTWTVESLPTNWMQIRDRWEYFHATRAAISVVGLSALILAVLVDTPTNLNHPRRSKGTRAKRKLGVASLPNYQGSADRRCAYLNKVPNNMFHRRR